MEAPSPDSCPKCRSINIDEVGEEIDYQCRDCLHRFSIEPCDYCTVPCYHPLFVHSTQDGGQSFGCEECDTTGGFG